MLFLKLKNSWLILEFDVLNFV